MCPESTHCTEISWCSFHGSFHAHQVQGPRIVTQRSRESLHPVWRAATVIAVRAALRRTEGGLSSTRFPTMLISVHQGPPPSATCPNTTVAAAGERRRTQVNETE